MPPGEGTLRTMTRVRRGAAACLALAICAAAALPACFAGAPDLPPTGGVAVVLAIKDAIGPATSRFFAQALETAQERHASLVVLELDTPGGLDTAMRDMIQRMLASPIPVVVYVAPSGARAASAGTYLLCASHIAAMAPATNVGAATPVELFPTTAPPPAGAPPEEASDKSKSEREARALDTHERKLLNDAVAYIRGLAELRHRNADWAESAVRQAASLTAKQALEQHVIELVAADLGDLLRQLDGRKVVTVSGEVTLATRDLATLRIEPDWRTQLLATLTNPNLAYLLLLIGIFGLLAEGYHPGAILPGVAGTISLLLALYSFQILSVNYAGLALLLFGIALIAAEAYVASFGALAVGGVVAFVMGSILLLDRAVPGFAIAGSLIATVALVFTLLVLALITYALRARAQPVATGAQRLLAETAVALGDFDERGLVRVGGELWQAVTRTPIKAGERLRIEKIDGLTLTVKRLELASMEPKPGG